MSYNFTIDRYPDITVEAITPQNLGYGKNIVISADVTYPLPIDAVWANITWNNGTIEKLLIKNRFQIIKVLGNNKGNKYSTKSK